MKNRTRILLLGVVTVAVTAVAVVTAETWYRRPVEVSIAVGPEDSPEGRFALKLAGVLQQSHASIRLRIETYANQSQALGGFTRFDADLAIVRSDDVKIPAHARALAVLEREAVLLIGTRRAPLSTLADLQGRRVVVVGGDGRNEAFLRRLLEQYKLDIRKTAIRTVAPGTPPGVVLPAQADLMVRIYPLSRLEAGNDFQELAEDAEGFWVHGLKDAKALQRKVPGLYVETIEAGLLSGAPRIPEEDMDTIALQTILIARRGLAEQHVVELMGALFENGHQLAVENRFATRIEPPDTEKGAQIAIHAGAEQYLAGEVRTVFERYSDLIYIGMSVLSVLGSMAVALYSTVFRRPPQQASGRVGEVMRLRQRIRTGRCPEDLDAAEAELETVLNEILLGLSEGTVSPHGLDAFRLAYDHAREDLTARRAEAKPR